MQNDVLKNNIAPWQEKGRWYHGKINFPSLAFDVDYTDPYIKNNFTLYTSGGVTYLNPNDIKLRCIDLKLTFSKDFTRSGTTTFQTGAMLLTAAGKQSKAVAVAADTGYLDFWAFIYED